ENGKVIAEARGEVRRGIEVVDFAAGMPTLLMGETVEGIARGIDSHTVRVPLGVVAGITPFNFPAMIPLWMFPLAITAGNTFVLKPSDRTPMTAVRLAELLLAAGVPAGVLNLVHGGREAVDALLDHPGVQAVSFVGSAPVARHVYARAAAAGASGGGGRRGRPARRGDGHRPGHPAGIEGPHPRLRGPRAAGRREAAGRRPPPGPRERLLRRADDPRRHRARHGGGARGDLR